MFVSASHAHHSEGWSFPAPGGSSTYQCLACLVDILEDFSVSRVQRGVALGLLSSMVENVEPVSAALIENVDKCIGMCNLIFDFYTKKPYKKTSVPLCVSLIHKRQNVFETFMERMNGIIYGNLMDVDLHFYMAVMHQLSQKSADYVKLLCFCDGKIIENIVKNRNHFDQRTVAELANLLKYVVRVMLETLSIEDQRTNSLLQEVMDALIVWLGSSVPKDVHVACLGLLSECIRSPVLTTAMLQQGREGGGSLMLMGLKRLLTTKDDTLVLTGTQCLTRLVQAVSDPGHIGVILDTDLAEFVFELLHTSNIYQLNSVFECVQAMAEHQLFFDKCHAIYGLESTLSALQMAMDTRNNTVLEKGLAFLNRLLDRQPENMPLFLNQSWWTCAKLLQECLQKESQGMVITALLNTEAFLRPKHQQSQVDVKVITSLLKTVMTVSQYHVQLPHQDRQADISITLECLFAIVNSINRLMLSDNIVCGNENSTLDELHITMKSLCLQFLLPWTTSNWQYLNEENTVQGFFTFLGIAIGLTENDEEMVQVMPMELFHRGLILLSQPHVPSNIKDEGLQTLIIILVKYSERVKPRLKIDSVAMLRGMSKIQWNLASCLDYFVERTADAEERGAVFALLYLSLLNGYSISSGPSLVQFLRAVVQRFPRVLSDEAVVVRSFIYILAVCQANTMEAVDSVVFEGSGIHLTAELEQLPVETWYTAGPAVFSWSLLTPGKVETFGKQMVEFWLVHLDYTSYQLPFCPESLTDHDQAILTAMVCNRNFLQCLMDLIPSRNVGLKARKVLEYCIAQLSGSNTLEAASSVLTNLLNSGIQKLDTLLIQSTELDLSLASNLLQVLCALLKSRVCGRINISELSCFKSVYNVVKLISKCWDQGSVVAPALEYFAGIVKGLSSQESQSIIPAMLQSGKFTSFLENVLASPSSEMFPHALAVVVWLAANGQHFEAEHFVTVRTELLMSYLASCSRVCSLMTLQLLRSALQAMADGRTMFGACHFFKGGGVFVPAKIFAPSDLRQIYGYLQQYCGQVHLSLRLEAMACIKGLVAAIPDIEEFVVQHPWNLAMFELLLSRAEGGLQEEDLFFCSLFSERNPGQVWSPASARSFLLALLNSSLSQEQRHKASLLVDLVKTRRVSVDKVLMDRVEACLKDSGE